MNFGNRYISLRLGIDFAHAPLATVTRPYTAVPSGNEEGSNAAFVPFDFSPFSFDLTPSTTYSIWVTTLATSELFVWIGQSDANYQDGQPLVDGGGGKKPALPKDGVYGFQVDATPLPEPSTIALVGLGLLGFLISRRN